MCIYVIVFGVHARNRCRTHDKHIPRNDRRQKGAILSSRAIGFIMEGHYGFIVATPLRGPFRFYLVQSYNWVHPVRAVAAPATAELAVAPASSSLIGQCT